MLLSEVKKKKSKKLPIRKDYKKKGCCCENAKLNEYYSDPEFDDYALMVRNALMREHNVDIEDANWVVDEENTEAYMHQVWFKMDAADCADKIAENLIISDGYVDKDAYRQVKLAEEPKYKLPENEEL